MSRYAVQPRKEDKSHTPLEKKKIKKKDSEIDKIQRDKIILQISSIAPCWLVFLFLCDTLVLGKIWCYSYEYLWILQSFLMSILLYTTLWRWEMCFSKQNANPQNWFYCSYSELFPRFSSHKYAHIWVWVEFRWSVKLVFQMFKNLISYFEFRFVSPNYSHLPENSSHLCY